MPNPDETGKLNTTPAECEEKGSNRDPEERATDHKHELKEKMLDKTLADSFPSSDPPSTIPDPSEEDSYAA